MDRRALCCTYLLACLFRKALILAVQGLMMLSDGETYCLVLLTATVSMLVLLLHDGPLWRRFDDDDDDDDSAEDEDEKEADEETYVSAAAILDWKTCRWYSMLLTSLTCCCCCSTGALTSLSPRIEEDIFGRWSKELTELAECCQGQNVSWLTAAS